MAIGFVYLMGNPFMPGLYKIGFTMRHPQERADELSGVTACPAAFEILAFFACDDPASTERDIHEELDEYRVSSNREFFDAPPDLIQELLRAYSPDPWDDVFISNKLDRIVEKQKEEDEKNFLLKHFHSQNIDHIFWPTYPRGLE